MRRTAVVAALQMVSGPEVAANLQQASDLLAQAATAGAQLVSLPENFAHMGLEERDKLDVAETDGAGPIQEFLAQQAQQHQIWLVGGSLPLVSNDSGRVYSACLVFSPAGVRIARYDKIHLFDVDVSAQETYRESNTVVPGALRSVVVDTPLGQLGLSICYDVRFPELFRRLAAEGMELLAVPSAFTARTGAAHWQVLLRARAIENQCIVIAAAQGGQHANQRETHGESMIVSPWGEVLARLEQGPGVAMAELDLDALHQLRRRFPALEHRRL